MSTSTGWSYGVLRQLLDAIAAEPAQLRASIEAAAVPVVAFDAQRRVLCANAPAEAYFGYDRHALDGTCIDDLVPPRLRQPNAPPPMVTPDIMHVELPGFRRDGTEVAAEWGLGGVEVDDGAGKRGVFLTAVRNPAEVASGIEALRQREERVSALIEGVRDFAIFMLDPGGRVITWSRSAERIKGYAAAEIIGEHFSRFFSEDERAAGVPERALRTAAEEVRCETEGWRLRKNGTRFWANGILTRLNDAEGRHIGFGKVTRDLTERRDAEENARRLFDERLARAAAERAEVAAREQGRQLRVLAEVSHFFASATLDPDAMLGELARACTELTGDACTIMVPTETPSEMIIKVVHHPVIAARDLAKKFVGQRVPAEGASSKALQDGRAVIVPVADPMSVRQARSPAYADVLDRAPVYSLLSVPLKANGKVVAAVSLSRHTPGQPFTAHDLALVEDLCDRIGLALDNSRLYQDLRAAVRARDDLLAVVSHDLRNALSVMVGSASLLERVPAGDNVRTRELGQRILKSGRRMDRLLQDLLDRARLESGKSLSIEPAPVAVAELLQEAVESFEPLAAQHGIRMEATPPSEACLVRADAGRLQQVFANLFSNALRHTPPEGTISLRASCAQGEVTVELADTGRGIPADALPRIFDPYWQGTGTEARRGLGLGLAVCRAVVDAHGGRIRAESTVGVGTRFFITIPEHRVVAEASRAPQA